MEKKLKTKEEIKTKDSKNPEFDEYIIGIKKICHKANLETTKVYCIKKD